MGEYSGTSDNGHSEKRTTSVERTNCLPPTNYNIQVITSEIGTTYNGQEACPHCVHCWRFHCISMVKYLYTLSHPLSTHT